MPTTLKVLHVASGDLWAGAEVQLCQLACALQRRSDIHLHVALLNHGLLEARLREASVPVTVLEERRLGLLRLATALRSLTARLTPGVVHSHRYKENLLAALALPRSLSGRARAIAVRTVHGAPEPAASWRVHTARLADTLSARLQHGAICVSPELLADVHRRFPTLAIEVIENGFAFDELDRAVAAANHTPLPGAGLHIGLVGRLVPVKRPDIFLATAEYLTKAQPDTFSFHVFGEGPLRRQCMHDAQRRGLAHHLHFHGFRPDMPAILAQLDALVLCSDHEGLPMVLLEAMGLRVPVIAHAVGGIPHVLANGRYGYLVHDHSPHGYAQALQARAQARASAAMRAAQACAHVRAHYAIDSVAERYVKFYRHLSGARFHAQVTDEMRT
ncbi:MAG: glycosyltransferase [Thiohalomonadaceae bacterium]